MPENPVAGPRADADLQAASQRQRAEIERLNGEIDKLNAANGSLTVTIRELETSRSWRITRPLRWLKDRFSG